MSENNEITSPVMLDKTGTRMADAMDTISSWFEQRTRVAPLADTDLACGPVIEAVGAPICVKDVTLYASYGITQPGWYVFARITAKKGTTVTSQTSVTGVEGYIATVGTDYIDVAVRFEVAAMSKKVVVDWGSYAEMFIFKATDLAVRNLDYRVTFYVYDIAEYTNWEYEPTTDTAVASDKYYYKKVNNEYVLLENPTVTAVPAYYTLEDTTYTKTTDETFEDGKTYYTKDVWYEQNESHPLTTDTVFVEGKRYYTLSEGIYELATVTPGDAVTPNTYYEQIVTYAVTQDTTFADGKDYYKYDFITSTFISDTVESGQAVPTDSYSAVTTTAGTAIPTYYKHSKVTFEGMVRNVTYVCNTPIDCPVVFNLPEIEDDEHGAWFEIRFLHTGSFSSTLVVPTGVKVATEHTQPETKGINSVDLHYSVINDTKVWRFLNTHSTIPA